LETISKIAKIAKQVAHIVEKTEGVFDGIVYAGPSIVLRQLQLSQYGRANLQFQLQTLLEGM
jgi:hypothetical protein